MPADQRPILGGRRGHHSEHLGHLLAVMQHIPRHLPERALVGPWPNIFMRLRVAEIVPETDEAMSIRFDVPDELARRVRVSGGAASDAQAPTSVARKCGAIIRCASRPTRGWSRSPSSGSRAACFPTGWRKSLKAGDTIDVMAPHGSFTVPFDAGSAQALCRDRGGIGDHADHVADPHRARHRAGQPLHPVLRQSRQPLGDLPRSAGGLEGPLHGAARAVPFPGRGRRRRRAVQRHARCGPLRRGGRSAGGRSGERRCVVHLRTRADDGCRRKRAGGARDRARADPYRTLHRGAAERGDDRAKSPRCRTKRRGSRWR